MKRRHFIKKSTAASLLISAGSMVSCFGSNKKLNVLVLGGTNFLGPAIVESLIESGHKPTLFNRGITNPHLFPDLDKIKGDRDAGMDGYKAINEDSEWDVVIDVWPSSPNLVEDALKVLHKKTKHYVFMSSIAVYNDYVEIDKTEDSPLTKGVQYEEGNYNLNKMLCENLIKEYFPQNFTIMRPGAIVGDRDPGPFGVYLLKSMNSRKEFFGPDSNDPVQFIDAFDIGRFTLKCCEEQIFGHFNLVGPQKTMGYKDFLMGIKEGLKSDVEIHWMDPEFLNTVMKLEPFSHIPFWIPVKNDPEPGFYQISNQKAIYAGLEFSDFAKTVVRSYDSVVNKRYIAEEGSESYFGVSSERADTVIAEWKKQL